MQGAVEQVESVGVQGLLATGTDGASLRDLVAQRVAAHRSRRAGAEALEAAREAALRMEHEALARESRRSVNKVRDAVRARYEKTQSYNEFLAAEAERALQQARAEAEVATRNAKAIAEAQMQLLEELAEQKSTNWPESRPSPQDLTDCHLDRSGGEADAEWRDLQLVPEPTLSIVEAPEPARSGDLFEEEPEATPTHQVSSGGLTVKLYQDLTPALQARGLRENNGRVAAYPDVSGEELEELEQEIAFRRAPEFIDHVLEAVPIPANLIEFPRQLVAPRKARPRLAEGPLRDESAAEPQLRIFEVEPEHISAEPSVPEEAASADGPEWQGILLDSPAAVQAAAAEAVARVRGSQPPDIAPVHRRLMALSVDACCVGAACVAFSTIVAYISGPGLNALPKPLLAGAVAIVFAASYLIYEALFFTFADATPGMRYARIGLCTFAEDNPSRKAMRRRIMAKLLAACPLGLGLLWVCMDDDRLGWHDRMSGMYQRSY